VLGQDRVATYLLRKIGKWVITLFAIFRGGNARHLKEAHKRFQRNWTSAAASRAAGDLGADNHCHVECMRIVHDNPVPGKAILTLAGGNAGRACQHSKSANSEDQLSNDCSPQVRSAAPVSHIESEGDYEQTATFLNSLLDVVRDDASHPLCSLVSLVGDLIEAYESDREPL